MIQFDFISIDNTTKFLTTSTHSPPLSHVSVFVGYISMIIATVFWGTFYLPVKHYELGDGIFFQFVMCIGAWVTGILINIIREFPTFYIEGVLAGFIWTFGNMISVPVIKFLGIGLGSVYWNIIGEIVAWGIARFGLFGVKAQIPTLPNLNYIGVSLTIMSIITFFFVKTEDIATMNKGTVVNETSNSSEKRPLIDTDNNSLDHNYQSINTNDFNIQKPNEKSRLDRWLESFSERSKKVLGTGMSIFAGIMFGFNYVPVMWVQKNVTNASQEYNDYEFSMCCGILISSLFVFVVYCIFEKNQPKIYPQAILPGFLTGLMWGIANICYNLGNDSLSMAISVPISNCGPSCVAFLVGVLYKEIKGTKNFLILILGTIFALVGSILCGLSL